MKKQIKKKNNPPQKRVIFSAKQLDALFKKEIAAKKRRNKIAAQKRALTIAIRETDAILKKEIAAKKRRNKAAAIKRAATIKRKKIIAAIPLPPIEEEVQEVPFEEAASIEAEEGIEAPEEEFPQRKDQREETGEFAPQEIYDNSIQPDAARILKSNDKAEVSLFHKGKEVKLSNMENFLKFSNMADELINAYYRLIEDPELELNDISPYVIWTRRRLRELPDSYYIVLEEIELIGLNKEQLEIFNLSSYFDKYFK